MEVSSELPASQPSCFTSGKSDPTIHWTGGWLGLRAILEVVEKRKISYPCLELNDYLAIKPVA